MCWIAAEAALWPLWEDNPSFVLDSNWLAGSGYIGKDSATEEVISSICPINSFSVVFRVVEGLPIDSIYCLINGVGLVKSNVIGVVVDRRRDREDSAGQHKEE